MNKYGNTHFENTLMLCWINDTLLQSNLAINIKMLNVHTLDLYFTSKNLY